MARSLRIRCREIADPDVNITVDLLLKSGFARSRNFWMRGLRRMSEHRTPPGYPRYGVLLEANDMPKDFPVLGSSTTVEYAFTDVAGREYLLPARAESEMLRSHETIKNVVSFVGYRKFSADSNIDFSDPGARKK